MSKTSILSMATGTLLATIALSSIAVALPPAEAESDSKAIVIRPIPERLVVLTFDDACRSHATFVAPLLKRFGFSGTFYITEFKETFADKTMYMTWRQIKGLDSMGFEVGNHSLRHWEFGPTGLEECTRQLLGIEEHCRANRVAKPTTFCWPVYSVNRRFFTVLTENGYLFARGGGNRPYDPTVDNPFNTPSFSISTSNGKRNENVFYKAVKQAVRGRIVILTFHGVPDLEHPSVGTDPSRFTEYMTYLKDNRYTVIAMRDLAKYVDAKRAAKLLPIAR